MAGICAVVLHQPVWLRSPADLSTAAAKRAEPASLGIDAARLNVERDAMLAEIQAASSSAP